MCAWVHAEQTDWITLSERAIWHWESKLDWPLHSAFLPSLTCSSWTVPRHAGMKISTRFWLCIICFSARLCNKSCRRSRAFTHSKNTSQQEGPFPYKSPTHEALQDSSAEQAVGNVCVYWAFNLTDCAIHSEPHFVLCRHSVLPNKRRAAKLCVKQYFQWGKGGMYSALRNLGRLLPRSSYTTEVSLPR